mgnify:CR=1 FL=1
MSNLDALEKEVLAAIAGASDETAIETVRVNALGKKGSVSALLATLGKMSPDERKVQGAAINALKDKVTQALTARRDTLKDAALDARLDPETDQRKFGARLSKSIPLNEQFSVTVQNAYGVSQPLVTAPAAGVAAPAQVIDSDQMAKLNFLPLGTSIFAGSKISSIDDRRLNSVGAEQNLLGGISLSGAVSDNAAGGHDRSLTARFKRSW